jgi:hypothetical protein
MLEFFQQFLLSFWNMMLWVAVNAIILLISAGLLRSLPGKKFMIDKRRLNIVALTLSFMTVVMVTWYAYQIWMLLEH